MEDQAVKMRVCYLCGDEKPLDQFARRAKGKDGRDNKCALCNKEQSRLYYHARKEGTVVPPVSGRPRKPRGLRKGWTHAEKARLNRHGLTKEGFDARMTELEGCEICGKPFEGPEPHIDHNHTTGKIRGLLCEGCNWTLGYMNDDVHFLEKAVAYLEKYKSEPLNVPEVVVEAVRGLLLAGVNRGSVPRTTWKVVLLDDVHSGVFHPDDGTIFTPVPTTVLEVLKEFAVEARCDQPLVPTERGGSEPLTPWGIQIILGEHNPSSGQVGQFHVYRAPEKELEEEKEPEEEPEELNAIVLR